MNNDYSEISKVYLEQFNSTNDPLDQLTDTEEMDILDISNECRHYKSGDRVKLHKGGEGTIRGIIYCVLIGEDGENDAIMVKGDELGEIIG